VVNIFNAVFSFDFFLAKALGFAFLYWTIRNELKRRRFRTQSRSKSDEWLWKNRSDDLQKRFLASVDTLEAFVLSFNYLGVNRVLAILPPPTREICH
jgi:hypothetical protein